PATPGSSGPNPSGPSHAPQLGPFLSRGKLAPRRPPKERVVGIKLDEAARAYPWPVLAERRVVHDRLGDQELVILYQPGTLSALDDTEIKRSRSVGATGAFSRVIDGRTLTFEATVEGFRD